MRRGILLATLGVVLGVVGCVGSDPTAVSEAQVVGDWTWVEASGGIAGRTLTPASTGVERTIRVLPGRAELWENGALVRSTGWQVTVGDPAGSFAGRTVVRWEESLLGGWNEQRVDVTGSDTLVLTDGCCDGYSWTFVRAGA